MKRFDHTALWALFRDCGIKTVPDPDTALDEFITELHAYCRSENNMAERIFGITISAPYDRKTKLLSRKKNDTPFLDKMRIAFREEAEKLHR